MKYDQNHLGFSHHLQNSMDDNLHNLNESVMLEVKNRKELSSIKNVSFDLESEPLRLEVTVSLRDGRKEQRIYSSHVDKSAVELPRYVSEAYFGVEKTRAISSFFDDGALEHEFLTVHEPDLCKQLEEDYLLNCAPNTMNGHEFTDSDLRFFLDIINEPKNAA